ncbi:hypothetical protein ACFQY7_16150 [Actinomadura luteofluorescens]|uniref:hypothetical protein n=1 Tax=Actinomadura luteofluorescens TaxID=46163 RepID=UPI0036400175
MFTLAFTPLGRCLLPLAFTLGAFTFLFGAFTLCAPLTFGGFGALPLGMLGALAALGFLARHGGLVLALFAGQPGLMLAFLAGPLPLGLSAVGCGPLGRCACGVLAGALGGQRGGDSPPVGQPGFGGHDQQQRRYRVHRYPDHVFLQSGVGDVERQGHGAGHPPQHGLPPAAMVAQAGQDRVEPDHDHHGGVHHQRQDRRRPVPSVGGVGPHQRGDRQHRVEHGAEHDQPRPCRQRTLG